MIAFTCSRCGMKLKVNEKFAGRSSKRPTGKHPLVVAQLVEAQAYVPRLALGFDESKIDGKRGVAGWLSGGRLS